MKDTLDILILEDNLLDADLLQRFLQRSGMAFNPTITSDRNEFVTAIDTKKFDVILADHSLPQFTSIEALDKIKEYKMDIPFILVTGTVSEEFAVNVLQQGADDYILKGNLQRLPSAIYKAIEKHKMSRDKLMAEEELKSSYQQLRQLASHLQDIREEERASMAREIHDELGQQLTGLKLEMSWLSLKLENAEKEIKQKIEEISGLLANTIGTVRKIATELRPRVLDDYGLVEAIKWLNIEYEKRTGIAIQFQSTPDDILLSDNLAIALFRIYQESLTNIMRHASATTVSSFIEIDKEQLTLTVSDNGKGFAPKAIGSKKTLGLLGMKERTSMLGGTFEIISEPGNGTKLLITFPFNKSLS